MLNQERIGKLQALAVEEGLAAFVVVPSASLVYLSGFSMGLSERPAFLFVPQSGEVSFLCPAFEADRVRLGSGVERLITYPDETGPVVALAAALEAVPPGTKIAFEYSACRLLEYDVVSQALGGNVVPVDARPLLARLRMAKDAEELAAMKEAVRAADAMVGAIHEIIAPGVSERTLQEAAEEVLAKDFPHAKVGFISIASGERTAIPHAGTTDRVLEAGDLVWMDLGAVVDGYVSDITRTFGVGEVDEELAAIHALVLKANRAACAAAKPGVTAGYLDEVARDVIRQGGYGEQFTHRTGHGIGLEIHEEPYIVGGSDLVLQPGHAFTIEPGIYLLGKGGVRIEDNVVITETGAEVLTSYPRGI